MVTTVDKTSDNSTLLYTSQHVINPYLVQTLGRSCLQTTNEWSTNGRSDQVISYCGALFTRYLFHNGLKILGGNINTVSFLPPQSTYIRSTSRNMPHTLWLILLTFLVSGTFTTASRVHALSLLSRFPSSKRGLDLAPWLFGGGNEYLYCMPDTPFRMPQKSISYFNKVKITLGGPYVNTLTPRI